MRKFKLKEKAAERMKNPDEAFSCAGSAAAAREVTFLENAGGIRVVWRTDVGRIRQTNEDAVVIGHGLAAVADGMGGHNGGEIASGGLRDGLLRELAGKEADRAELEGAVERINLELWEKQEHDASLTGMGTTLTALWPTEKEMIIAHVGDSRAYLLRSGELRQMTRDHSMVADMVRRGVLTEEQAACHPMRNYITRAVGTEDTIEVDMYTEKREAGDRWLVCSDGLYGQMTHEELDALVRTADPEEAADRLLRTALENGGKDNITLILLDDTTGAPPEEEETPEDEAPAAEADGQEVAGDD